MEILGVDSLNTVWIQATPTFPVSEDDDGSGGVAETLSEFQSLRVSGDIPLHELNVSLIQETLRENATVAGRGSNDGNQ